MKILFLYTKFDNALRDKVKHLEAHNAEVHTLSLLEYKLTENGTSTILETSDKLDFLEKFTPKPRLINRIFKRKKLINSLDDYDIIDLYKCEKTALFIVDEIREKCYDFFVTPSHEKQTTSFFTKYLYTYLYKKARFLLFTSTTDKDNFTYDNEEKRRLICQGVNGLKEIDNISEEALFKASFAMGFDLDKDIIYCDMSGSIHTQITFINDLLSLPEEKLRQSTFIFHLNRHNLEERTTIKNHLEAQNFDYLLIETLITPAQNALLYKISDKSIILSVTEDNPALILSLYAKNHTYLYTDIFLDERYQNASLFIDTFSNFKEYEEQENPIINDLLQANQQKIAALFDQEVCINQYIEVLKEV